MERLDKWVDMALGIDIRGEYCQHPGITGSAKIKIFMIVETYSQFISSWRFRKRIFSYFLSTVFSAGKAEIRMKQHVVEGHVCCWSASFEWPFVGANLEGPFQSSLAHSM